MERLLLDLSINVTAMFRDPSFYIAFREKVVPALRTYPFTRIWVAGCSTGEEVYSLAILLQEEQIYDRTRIYATDINESVLEQARAGVFPLDKMREYTQNYIKARRNAGLLRVLRCEVRRRTVPALADRERRLRPTQPRLGPVVQRVQRDHLPERDDLFRPRVAGPRPPALLRKPRDVRHARARAQGVDPLQPARKGLRRARSQREALPKDATDVRHRLYRRVVGRIERGRARAQRPPARARPSHRDRTAPPPRRPCRDARRTPGREGQATSARRRGQDADRGSARLHRAAELPPVGGTRTRSRFPSTSTSSSRVRR